MKKLIRKIERRTCGRDTANAVAALQTLYAADPVNAIVTFKEFADALKQEGTVGYQVIDALRAQGDPAGIGFEATRWATAGDILCSIRTRWRDAANHLYGETNRRAA